jgi:membrane-associated HD superfamily phosphohydrolase
MMQQGVGDAARLEYILDRLENGKFLYHSDKQYLENLLYADDQTNEQTVKTESNSLEKLNTELKSLNTQLENILKNKQRTEKTKPDNDSKVQTEPKTKLVDENIIIRRKSEEITLVLSVVLGLISLQGIGHLYIGKIARGAGILVLSLLLSAICAFYFVGIMPKSIPTSFTSVYLLPIIAVGYLGLYVFQVLDSRKLCVSYNQYMSEQGKSPPWW